MFAISQAAIKISWQSLEAKIFFSKISFPPQTYIFAKPPLVMVTRGRMYSEVSCFLDHITHRVRLYHIQGKEAQMWL